MRTAPLDDYEEEPRGLWARIKDKVGFGEFEEDADEVVEEEGRQRRPVMLRVHSSRMNKVSVWKAFQKFEDSQAAADGLKEGRQQIVNLEKVAQEIGGRVIDFLSGVTYALDGSVQRVGEKVYLFTPANYEIEMENDAEKSVRSFLGG